MRVIKNIVLKAVFSAIFALSLFGGTITAQIIERDVEAVEELKTGYSLVYQTVGIPALDITYHEFSADSITWRKNYVDGDCYIRFANTTSNTASPYTGQEGYHDTWWVLNLCTLGSGEGTSLIDTIIVVDGSVADTVTSGTVTIPLRDPATITGSTTNSTTDSTHTHNLVLYMGEIENVDTTGVADGKVLKWNAVSEMWEISDDLIGGGTSTLTVRETDGTPSVSPVYQIWIDNGHVTDLGAGKAQIDFSLDPVEGEQDFFRTDTVSVSAGDTFLTFSSALPANDYIVANAYALYSNGERQPLSYDSLAVDGFRVLGVADESLVHYLVIRNLDSLGVILDSYGKVGASSGDVLGFLNSKTDDSTITVIDNELVFVGDTVDINQITTQEVILNGDSIRATTQLTDADTTMATSAWVLSVAGAGNGWDSITTSDNKEYYIWWYAGVKIDSVQRTGIFVELADATTEYVTPSQLVDSIENANGLRTMIYDIKLPAAASLGARIAAMSEGDAFDLGWTLTVNGTADLDVQHDLNRRVVSVSVFVVTGNEEQELYDTAAHNGLLSLDTNNVRIRSLATTFLSKDIVVYLTFK